MKETKHIVYRDKRYGFTLQLPAWWNHYVVIDKTTYDMSAEYELHINFKYRGKTYTDVLNIAAYRMSREEWEQEGYADSPLMLLGEREGRLFAYSTPEELPSVFLDPKTGDYNYARFGKAINLLKRMVNIDVPQIVRTFRFPLQPVLVKPYLSSLITKCGSEERK